ncbi:hypothetical protein K445DRAFT_24800 [Daldinia sp. EC12]|nr:hypothetical protein F4774DRAFT_54056 [Daldinia eschscholtzii]OTB13304.1 hypothetical protein K445DRAFT_24800 [Daldinia sp. EC12]
MSMSNYPSTRPEGMDVGSPRNIGSRKKGTDKSWGKINSIYILLTRNPEAAIRHTTSRRSTSLLWMPLSRLNPSLDCFRAKHGGGQGALISNFAVESQWKSGVDDEMKRDHNAKGINVLLASRTLWLGFSVQPGQLYSKFSTNFTSNFRLEDSLEKAKPSS